MRKIAVFFWIFLSGSLAGGVRAAEFELNGRVLRSDGKPFTNVVPQLFLRGSTFPYSAQAQAGLDGRFKFKKLAAGPYTLSAAVPRTGEKQLTIDIGPSHADSKGRVTVTLTFPSEPAERHDPTVSAAALSVPEKAQQEYFKAERFLGKKDVERAKACLHKAVEIAPQFAAAWNSLGVIAYQSRDFPLAEKHFREALRQDPEEYSPLVNLGGALLSQGKDKDSLPINLQAVKARPGDALAQSQLGQSYFFLGRIEDAEKHLKQAKALDPGHFSHPQLILARIYAQRNDLEGLIAEWTEFLRLHPDDAQAPGIRQALEKARALKAGR